MDKAEVIKIIKTTLLRRGDGVIEPIRLITQYWDFDGKLLWEDDPSQADARSTLDDILFLLDNLEKQNGDAPHRAVDPCTRIKVLVEND